MYFSCSATNPRIPFVTVKVLELEQTILQLNAALDFPLQIIGKTIKIKMHNSYNSSIHNWKKKKESKALHHVVVVFTFRLVRRKSQIRNEISCFCCFYIRRRCQTYASSY
jgi:hypothetical protein